MKRVIYVSDCLHGPFEVHDLDIMREALSYNSQHGITGFLHRTNDHYFQCIEGSKHQVDHLIHKIRSDLRHVNFCLLAEDEIPYTSFPGWSMGYSKNLKKQDGTQLCAGTSSSDILQLLLVEANRQIAELQTKSGIVSG